MKITKQLVASLRETTGAGLQACHKALKAVNGNIEAAIEALKKEGQKIAATKVDRPTHQGKITIGVAEDTKKAIMLKVTCETDFALSSAFFQDFLNKLTKQAIENDATSIETLLDSEIEPSKTVHKILQETISQMGENIRIDDFHALKTAHHLGAYTHQGRSGAIVELKGGNHSIAKEMAIQIVIGQTTDKAAILEQEFYKDPSQTVAQYLAKEGTALLQCVFFKL